MFLCRSGRRIFSLLVSAFSQCGVCDTLRAKQSIPALRFTLLGMTTLSTDRRSARSHCEKSGNSGGDSASARNGCAQTTGSRRVQRPLADFAESPQSKRCTKVHRNGADLACPLSERWRRRPRFFAVLDLLLLLDQAKSREEQAVDSHASLHSARNDKS